MKKPSGLEDVVVCESSICYIDGKQAKLVYRGYDIEDLCENSTFEEVAYLLWNGRLPNHAELSALQGQLFHALTLPSEMFVILESLPIDSHPMRVLQSTAASIAMLDPQRDDMSEAANRAKAIRLTSQLSYVTTVWHRIRERQDPVRPESGKSFAYNFLKMLFDKEPDPFLVRTMDVALILHADHELNASTFSARVTAATLSDMHSAISSAIGTLKGPLHGGANEAVVHMLEEIGTLENVPAYMERLLANKQKVMGFGHRVYKQKDPRGVIMEKYSAELGRRLGDSRWIDMSRKVEEIFQPTVASKGVYPNVDFYSASVYRAMGIPDDLFTPIFACSRVVGWTAHLLEQYANNRLFRPISDYEGPRDLKWAPVEER